MGTELGRCDALLMSGERCRRRAVIADSYHGDDGLYSHFDNDAPTWVRVELCAAHGARSIQQRREKRAKRLVKRAKP